jgi:hypothetical protein
VTVTVGRVVSPAAPAPLPDTSLETLSPSALTLTFTLDVPVTVGVKRTVTTWVAPCPTRLNELPDTMLNGALVDTVPATAPARVFDTVMVRSATLPRFTVPKLTVPAGLTPKLSCATALATLEQELS